MKWISPAAAVLAIATAGAAMLAGCDQGRPAAPARDADGNQLILTVDEVRVGMRGYGLSVFHGATIEPFPVEVISVQQNASAGRSAIWIRCTDARMQQSGPVAGMSGSPIYLWSPGESRTLGKGGKLIGAFAWGYQLSKDCYVGVQPIEYMRQAARRAQEQNDAEPEAQAKAAPAAAMIRTLLAQARQHDAPGTLTWQAEAIAKLLSNDDAETPQQTTPPAPRDLAAGPGAVQPLLMPVNVGSPQLAQLLQPLFAPAGMTAYAAPQGASVSKPPPGVDIDKVKLQPGSVLAEPLAWGDLDLSAAGTVTDVLADGTVLAFGHADSSMAQGRMNAPMATGYVHMVMPMLTTSFKHGGSGVIQGALVRNEQAGVIGAPGATFKTAPIDVSVQIPGQPKRDYHYQSVYNKRLTPIIAAVVTYQSLSAAQEPPIESTMRLKSTMKFEGDIEINVNRIMPGGDEMSVIMATLPPVSALASNHFKPTMLESMTTTIDVEPGLKSASIVEGALDRATVAPGGDVTITVKLQPYNKEPFEHRITLTVPSDLPDGDYPLFVTDAQTYVQTIAASRPHLLTASNLQQLEAALKRLMSIRDDALYVTLQLEQHGLAIGQQEFPRLPSSKMAMIASPVSTLATPYRDTVETVSPLDVVPSGAMRFVIQVDAGLKP